MTKRGLSGSALKWIAVISMLVDHAAVVFFVASREVGRPLLSADLYIVLRCIGRLAFPLYAFLLAEGFFHTRSVEKYLLRLFLFGVVSEIPFDLAFRGVWLEGTYQNVYFTLALGLLAVWLWMRATGGEARSCGAGRVLLGLLGVAAAAFVAWLGKTDYGAWGVLTIAAMVILRRSEWKRDLFVGAFLLGSNMLEAVGFIDFVLLHFYNEERGRQPKYFFYLFYPTHLLVLALLSRAVYGG